jgi:hypothetical protein
MTDQWADATAACDLSLEYGAEPVYDILDQLARRTATYIYGLYSAHTAPEVSAMIFRPECALELQALAAAHTDPRLSGLTEKVKQLTANSGSAHWGRCG